MCWVWYQSFGCCVWIGWRTKNTFIKITVCRYEWVNTSESPTKTWYCRLNSSPLSLLYRPSQILWMKDREVSSWNGWENPRTRLRKAKNLVSNWFHFQSVGDQVFGPKVWPVCVLVTFTILVGFSSLSMFFYKAFLWKFMFMFFWDLVDRTPLIKEYVVSLSLKSRPQENQSPNLQIICESKKK